ncbi:TPA: heavy metal sensor histidine kinase [Pseudomonas aeruginosa]
MNGIPPLSSRDAHASPPQRVLERLHSSAAGLDADEAARRLAAHGYNRLPAPKRQGPLLRLLRQFHNVLLYMMLFASLVTALLGFWVDSAVILLAVVVNALIGFVQEGKAANALDAIRDMLSLHALVLRDGQRQALDAERLVPGDVVLLASGDRVPADLRLFETKNFHVDESALTGESVPVEKGCVAVAIDALLGDRRCMAYSGTLVTSGQARGVVVATAGDTELGRIGTLLREVRTLATPLLRQIASFSRWLALAILLLAGATFVLGTLWQGQPMVDMFMLVVALTASAIPEGLPAIMTVILALGVLLASLLGHWIARLGLWPVHRLSEEARRISPRQLSQRLQLSPLPAELRELVGAFNGALDRLEQAYVRLESFNADVAHELRTPLTNLIGQTQVALSRERSGEHYEEVLQSNLEELERLRAIVNDMLFLARADQGRLACEREETSLAGEIATTVDFLEVIFDEAGVGIEVRGEARALVERALFQRAVTNLLYNAAQHTAAGGTLRVGVERRGDEVRVAVSNPGVPIADEHRRHLFERFYRVDAARSNSEANHGLGLSIVKAVASMHGGSVFVDSADGWNTFGFTVLSPERRGPGDRLPLGEGDPALS